MRPRIARSGRAQAAGQRDDVAELAQVAPSSISTPAATDRLVASPAPATPSGWCVPQPAISTGASTMFRPTVASLHHHPRLDDAGAAQHGARHGQHELQREAGQRPQDEGDAGPRDGRRRRDTPRM